MYLNTFFKYFCKYFLQYWNTFYNTEILFTILNWDWNIYSRYKVVQNGDFSRC